MKVSLRVRLYQAIKDYTDCRDRIGPVYEQAKEAMSGEVNVVMEELRVRDLALTEIWKEASPEMNSLERQRYVSIIGKPMDGGACVVTAGKAKEYPSEVLDALAKIQKVFPGAKIYEPGMKASAINNRCERPPGELYGLVGIKRKEDVVEPQVKPEAKEEQMGLL